MLQRNLSAYRVIERPFFWCGPAHDVYQGLATKDQTVGFENLFRTVDAIEAGLLRDMTLARRSVSGDLPKGRRALPGPECSIEPERLRAYLSLVRALLARENEATGPIVSYWTSAFGGGRVRLPPPRPERPPQLTDPLLQGLRAEGLRQELLLGATLLADYLRAAAWQRTFDPMPDDPAVLVQEVTGNLRAAAGIFFWVAAELRTDRPATPPGAGPVLAEVPGMAAPAAVAPAAADKLTRSSSGVGAGLGDVSATIPELQAPVAEAHMLVALAEAHVRACVRSPVPMHLLCC